MDQEHPSFKKFSTNVSDIAEKWTVAYETYANGAQDVSGDSALSTNRAGFKAELLKLFSNNKQNPTSAVNAYAAAFTQYWTGGTFAVGKTTTGTGGNGIFGVEASSSVTVVLSVGLKAALTTIFFSKNPSSINFRAIQLANAFHAATTTEITVLITGIDTTTPTPLPITNTGTIS